MRWTWERNVLVQDHHAQSRDSWVLGLARFSWSLSDLEEMIFIKCQKNDSLLQLEINPPLASPWHWNKSQHLPRCLAPPYFYLISLHSCSCPMHFRNRRLHPVPPTYLPFPPQMLPVVRICDTWSTANDCATEKNKQGCNFFKELGYVFANLGIFLNMFMRHGLIIAKQNSCMRTCIHPTGCSGLISNNSNTRTHKKKTGKRVMTLYTSQPPT